MNDKKAVILLSGGLDSATVVAMASLFDLLNYDGLVIIFVCHGLCRFLHSRRRSIFEHFF